VVNQSLGGVRALRELGCGDHGLPALQLNGVRFTKDLIMLENKCRGFLTSLPLHY
jgi:hypothetical protein